MVSVAGQLSDEQVEFSGDGIAALRNSVIAHQVADVEVGAYLSGGMDSAAVVALMQKGETGLRSFTLDVGDDPAEASNAAETARLLGVANDLQSGTLDAAQRLRQLTWHLEMPNCASDSST